MWLGRRLVNGGVGWVCKRGEEAFHYNRTRSLSWSNVHAGAWSVTTFFLTVTFFLTKRENVYGGGRAVGQWGWKGPGNELRIPL